MLLKAKNSRNVWFSITGFLNHGFEFQDSACNGCHDWTMLSVNISDIAITTVKNVDHCCILYPARQFETIILLDNSVLEDCHYI